MAILCVTALAVLASGTLWRSRRPHGPVSKAIDTLLILPFKSLDAGRDNDYLAQGVSEQVTAKLMKLRGLRLLSPEAAHRVKSDGASPTEAGKRLGADAVLVGSVRSAHHRIRVNAQLIRTVDGQVLWADGGVEVQPRDILEAERVLAAAIATRLRGALTAREREELTRTPTSNAQAYELFVRGKIAMRDSETKGGFRLAEQLFEEAVRIDPDSPEALAWLALAQAVRFTGGMSGDEVRQASIENARRAIAIDPNTTTARCALIRIYHTTGQAEQGLKQATILRKSGATGAVSLAPIAEAYERAGMPDRAIPIYQQALRMDPEEPTVPQRLAFAAYWVGQHRLGQQVLETQLQKQVAPLVELNLAVASGQRQRARSVGFESLEDGTDLLVVAFSGFILRSIGEGTYVRRILRERLPAFRARMADVKNERGQIALGLIYSILGDKSDAHKQKDLALEMNPGDPWTLFFSSEIEAELRDDRQAIDLLQRSLARGFLAQHYLNWPYGPLYRLRTNPEVRVLRKALSSRIASLRKQY